MRHPWLISLAALAGCSDARALEQSPKRELPPPPPPAAAPELHWNDNHLTFTADLDSKPKLSASLISGTTDEPLTIELSWNAFPTDSVVAFGDQRVDTEHGSGRMRIVLPDPASLSIVHGLVRTSTVPLVITVPGHEPASTQLPPLYPSNALYSLLEKVPLPLPGEPDDARLDTAAILGPFRSLDFVGTGTTLGDVDWIAIASQEELSTKKKCSGYLGRHSTVEISFGSKHVAIRDRRTGALVVETTLKPSTKCPSSVFADEEGRAVIGPDPGAAMAWVRSQLAQRSKRPTDRR